MKFQGLGLLTFFIANFTTINNLSVICGCIQVTVNFFVFICWLNAYKKSKGLIKFVAFWGVVVPPIMAMITFCRVLLPAMLK
jgi:hypothetical protein